MTKKFRIQDSLPVEQFYSEAEAEEMGYKEARELAFDRAQEAKTEAYAILKKIAEEHGLAIQFSDDMVEFDEFDAGNLSHANAYYWVGFVATREDAERLVDTYYGDLDYLEEVEGK